jgi:ABC-type glucose/galactose transport system permease subunit
MLKIAVIDAQGGGFGKAIVEGLSVLGDKVDILALGTNVYATMAMRKAGAHRYATGENAICFNADKVDIIIGGIGILASNSMLGEITPAIAHAVSSSHAKKIVIPFGKCNITVPGISQYTLKELVDMAVETVVRHMEEQDG